MDGSRLGVPYLVQALFFQTEYTATSSSRGVGRTERRRIATAWFWLLPSALPGSKREVVHAQNIIASEGRGVPCTPQVPCKVPQKKFYQPERYGSCSTCTTPSFSQSPSP